MMCSMSREETTASSDALGQARHLRRYLPLLCFAMAVVIAFPLMLVWGRRGWFTQDDWDFLSARTAWNVGDLFRPHFEHWSTLPILLYRLLWVLVGIRHYPAYQAVLVALHLLAAVLLLVVMRRAGVRPWTATLVAVVFVYFGAGAENILVAFNVTFVGSLVFGLVQLLLADHDGPIDRRDWLGLVAGLMGLLCSGVAVTMAVIVGISVLLRRGVRGWRVAAFHVLPLAGAYVLWLRVAPRGQRAGGYHSESPMQVMRFVLIGIENLFARLGQVPGVGIALGFTLISGLLVLFRERGGRARLAPFAPALALLAGGLVFLIAAGIQRSGQGGYAFRAAVTGPERARESRYVHLTAAMALPALALGADSLMRRWRRLTVPVVALLLVGIPGNVHLLATPNRYFVNARFTRDWILTIPRLPLVDQLRHSHEPIPTTAFRRFGPEGLTFGWLVAGAASGRIPAPGRLSPVIISNEVLHFFLEPSTAKRPVRCVPAPKVSTRVLARRQTLTIERGGVYVRYVPVGGPASNRKLVGPATVIALVGPLRLLIVPASAGVLLCE